MEICSDVLKIYAVDRNLKMRWPSFWPTLYTKQVVIGPYAVVSFMCFHFSTVILPNIKASVAQFHCNSFIQE